VKNDATPMFFVLVKANQQKKLLPTTIIFHPLTTHIFAIDKILETVAMKRLESMLRLIPKRLIHQPKITSCRRQIRQAENQQISLIKLTTT